MENPPKKPLYPSFEFPQLEPKLSTFRITIADSYVGYQYEFQIREDTSIADIVRGIAERFQTQVPQGKMVWEAHR
jgi:hypothetical protein